MTELEKEAAVAYAEYLSQNPNAALPDMRAFVAGYIDELQGQAESKWCYAEDTVQQGLLKASYNLAVCVARIAKEPTQ